MNITSKIINKLLKIFFTFIFLIIAFSFLLANGISIDKIKLVGIEIHEFYLKLDKKLVLNIDKVYIKKANKNKEINIANAKKTILSLREYKQILLIFKEIKINEIHTDGNNVRLYYDREILNLYSNNLELNLKINFNSSELLAKIIKLQYKDIYFYGDLKIANKSEINGYIHTANNDFSSKIYVLNRKNDIDIKISNLHIKNQLGSLEHIKDIMTPTMKEWLIKRVSFDDFKGDFEFAIRKNKLVKTLGLGYFNGVKARYNDRIPRGLADSLKLSLNDFTIELLANDIKSEDDIKVKEFKLYLKNLPTPDLEINITAENILYTKEIDNLIRGYDVDLGLRQLSGSSNANVDIYANHDNTSNVKVKVKSSGSYVFNNFAFKADDVNVSVDDGKVSVSANAKTKEIVANGLNLKIDARNKVGDVVVNDAYINFSNVFEYKGKANLKLDLNTKNLYFKELNTNILLQDTVNIKAKVKDILPYFKKKNEFNIQSGDIEIKSKDKNISIDILNANFDLGLYKNSNDINDIKAYLASENNKYTKDDFRIKVSEDAVKVNTKSNILSIEADSNNTNIIVSNAIVDIANLKESDSRQNENIYLKNTKVIYKDFLFNFKNLDLEKTPDNTLVKSEFNLGGNLISIINKDTFKAYIRDLSYKTLNEILSKKIIINGLLDADVNGKNINDFDGLINLRDVYLANTRSYTNLIAFLESIPSLISLKSPGFTKKGLKATIGSIEFSRKDDFINIKDINIKGNKADWNGKGSINLSNNNADILLNIFTLKNTNKMISSIPVVKEIVMGDKENKIATQIKVYGNLDDLKFKTSIAKDIITSPISLIKNIVNLPKNLMKN